MEVKASFFGLATTQKYVDALCLWCQKASFRQVDVLTIYSTLYRAVYKAVVIQALRH